MNGGNEIGAVTEPQVEIGGLQTEHGQIRLRVVGDELGDARGLQVLQRIGDAPGVGARRKRTNHAPEMVRRVASKFNDFRAIGQHNPIQAAVVRIHQRGIAPVIDRIRNEFEPVGIGDKGAVHTNDAQKNLIAGRGFVADQKLPALAAGFDDERNAGRFETEFHVRIVVVAEFGGADAGGGREFLERVEQGFDGG